jgi:F0F1-type ATP synthase assembly protein I
MEHKKERDSADESFNSAGENTGEQVSDVKLPPVNEFPEPPVVNYTRPVLKRGQYAQQPDEERNVGANAQNDYNAAARLGADLSAGMTFAASVIVSVLIGMWLDKKFEPNSVPWITLVMTPLGFVAGFLNIMRISAVHSRNGKRPK